MRTDDQVWADIVNKCRIVNSEARSGVILRKNDELARSRAEVEDYKSRWEQCGVQCAESLALNVELETRIALAEKVLDAAKIMHNPEHWKRNIYCLVCTALNVYYSTGFILYGPGGD